MFSRAHITTGQRVSTYRLIHTIAALFCVAAPQIPAETAPYEARPENDEDAHSFLFSIPAPRGLIIDRNGEIFARNRTVTRAGLIMGNLGTEDAEIAANATKEMIDHFPFSDSLLQIPDLAGLRRHWEHRRELPLLLTEPLSDEETARIREAMDFEPSLHLQTEYQREYPKQSSACHIIGYVSRDILRPAGPHVPREALWPAVVGTDGIEQVLDFELRGKPGLLNVVCDDYGQTRYEQLIREPEPGLTAVLSIDARMQRLAELILASNGRPGAFVAIDSATGDILAMASHPTFDLGQFIPSISAEKLASLQKTPGNPFFPRAHGGRYPPGSIFKPVIALGAMRSGKVSPYTRYYCKPSLRIAGRTFHNWNRHEYGNYTVRQALMRSTNTWFYQAALKAGSTDLIRAAREFGLGEKPILPLDGVTAGNVPEKIVADRGLANFSIGQGELLVSPLQMALAMSGIANGGYIPKPRLILQFQSPPPEENVLRITPVLRPTLLDFDERALDAVRQGMLDVVQNQSGTGKAAAAGWPRVAGKTGTAQWTADGKERNIAWFSGYVDAQSPRIAFAVMCEGRPGEHIFGGRVSAPMAGSFIRTIYKNPKTYHVTTPGNQPKWRPTDDLEAEMEAPVTLATSP